MDSLGLTGIADRLEVYLTPQEIPRLSHNGVWLSTANGVLIQISDARN